MKMNRDEIMNVIPHRSPMLFVDEVTEMVPKQSIQAQFYLNPALDFFRGHFPGDPVMPGVLTVEAMAQTADILLLSMDEYAGKVPLFIGIDEVKFKAKILPGETITIEAKISHMNEKKAVVTCEAVVYNGETIAATGKVTLAMR